MNFLKRLFLAKDEAKAGPPTDSALRQNYMTMWAGQLASEVKRVIGVFNPRCVGMREHLQMRLDPDVSFAHAIVRAPLINAQFTVESKDPVVKAAVEQEFKRKYRRIAKAGSLALGFGYQVVEKTYKPKRVTVEIGEKLGEAEEKDLGTKWSFDKIKAIDPRTLSLVVDEGKDEWAGVRQNSLLTGRSTDAVIGPERVSLWSYRSEDVFGDLRGYGKYDDVYSPWWEKIFFELAQGRYYERHGDPTPIGRADASYMRGDKALDGFELMEDVMQAIKLTGGVILPSLRDDKGNFKYDLSYLLDDQRGDMFQIPINARALAVRRAFWLTDEVGTEQGSGSRARAEVHADTMSETLESILYDFFEDFVNPQFVDDYVRWNFGEQALEESDTRLCPAGLSSGMKDLLKEVLFKQMDAESMQQAGKRVPLAKILNGPAIMKSLDLPLVNAEELQELEAEQEEEVAKAEEAAKALAEAPPMDAAARKQAMDQMKDKGIVD
jgi:hypothetical protein